MGMPKIRLGMPKIRVGMPKFQRGMPNCIKITLITHLRSIGLILVIKPFFIITLDKVLQGIWVTGCDLISFSEKKCANCDIFLTLYSKKSPTFCIVNP